MKRIKQSVVYVVVISLMFLGRVLPKRHIYGISKWLVGLHYRKKPKQVEIMHANIQKAFPTKKEDEILDFGVKVYEEVAKTLAEIILLYNRRIDIASAVLNADEAISKFKTISKSSKGGVIIITAHYANWELLGHFCGYYGLPNTSVGKNIQNTLLDQKVVIPFRQRYGNRMIGQNGSMVTIAKTLRKKGTVSLLIDQVVEPPNGIAVKFFGHKTFATKSVAALKLKYDSLVVPVFIERVGVEQFIVNIEDPIEVPPNIYTDKQTQIQKMTQSYYDCIEEQIRQRPEQWLWMYNRWKKARHNT